MRSVLLVAFVACKSSEPTVTPARCALRLTKDALFVDGAPHTRDEAVALCKKTQGAVVQLDDGASDREWRELRAALQATGTKIYVRGVLWDASCNDNPLAKGCP